MRCSWKLLLVFSIFLLGFSWLIRLYFKNIHIYLNLYFGSKSLVPLLDKEWMSRISKSNKEICTYRTDCQEFSDCSKYEECGDGNCEMWNFIVVPLSFGNFDEELVSSIVDTQNVIKKYHGTENLRLDKFYLLHSTLAYFCCISESTFWNISSILKEWRPPFQLQLEFEEVSCNGFYRNNHPININAHLTERSNEKLLIFVEKMEDYIMKKLGKQAVKKRRKDMTKMHLTIAKNLPSSFPLQIMLEEIKEKKTLVQRVVDVNHLLFVRSFSPSWKDWDYVRLNKKDNY